MSWDSILKIRYKLNWSPENEPPEFFENNKGRFIIHIAGKTPGRAFYGQWVWQGSFASRQEAYDAQKKKFIEKANPRPWTMEGNLYQGIASVYDGPAMVLGAPRYYYYISDGLDDMPPENPEEEIRVGTSNPDRVLDRMEGLHFDRDRDDFPEHTKEENR